MKIILSRKGFDSKSGGCQNPILPDGTLLSLPIPSEDALKYSELRYGEFTYDNILNGIKPNKAYSYCHLDPDIRTDVRIKPIVGWKPAFGQANSALGVLRNAGVTVGDLFLFFGLFRQTEMVDGKLKFIRGIKPIQIVYGYLQIGDILDNPESIAKYHWHPHANKEYYEDGKNSLYIPSRNLSINPSLPGFGILSYRTDRVLTKLNENAATWEEHSFLMPDNILGNRKNCAKRGGLYYAGQWQELVLKPNADANKWVMSILR